MRRRKRIPALTLRTALAAAALALLAGCDWYYNDLWSPDDLMHAIPWFDHMIYQKSVHPYSRADIPRNTPDGTVPITGGEADWSAEWATGKTTTADRLVNLTKPGATPIPEQARRDGPMTPQIPATVEARGDTLFHTYCAVCHGPTGMANGPVSPKIGAPPLVTDRARAFSDGYIYSIIRYGRGVMPRYGDKVHDPMDRWAVVDYVRKLQAEAAPPAPPASAAAPAPAPGGRK